MSKFGSNPNNNSYNDADCALDKIRFFETADLSDCTLEEESSIQLLTPNFGACCINGECSITTQIECISNSGIYYGDGSDCNEATCVTPTPTPPPPDIGACCMPDGTCTDEMSASGCNYYGGTLYIGKSCSDPEVVCETPTPPPDPGD